MNPDYLDAAEQLAASLLFYKHVEQRAIALARVLNVLAASVDNTDAYEPLTTIASKIDAQARENIRVQIEELNGMANEQQSFSAPRYNPKVQA